MATFLLQRLCVMENAVKVTLLAGFCSCLFVESPKIQKMIGDSDGTFCWYTIQDQI